jgi:glycogen debranching enzyme
VFCWDSFFNALELAVESPELAKEALRGVLDTQYPNGNIPNWRGRFDGTPDRSHPPVGSWVALSMFLRTGDREILELAYPYLKRWFHWWSAPKRGRPRRGGSRPGLFAWGSDIGELRESPAAWENASDHRQKAAWESGQDDLPNWDDAVWNDDTETLALDVVDLSAYLALDAECLDRIAGLLALDDDQRTYRMMRRQISNGANDHLWNDEAGAYLDRHWDGAFSQRLAASNFLPLLAGIPDPRRAARLVATLTDRDAFWGEFIVPTISKGDPAYGDQQYWRGSIWPPMNYMLCHGLRRYGYDREAADLARRSVELSLESWRRQQVCWENYDSRTGRGAGKSYQSWGPLLSLLGIEEFVSVTPWDGVRIGTVSPPAGTVRNVPVGASRWSVSHDGSTLQAARDGVTVLTCEPSAVLREIELDDDHCAVQVTAQEPVTLRIVPQGPPVEISVDGVLVAPAGNAVSLEAGHRTVTARVIA